MFAEDVDLCDKFVPPVVLVSMTVYRMPSELRKSVPRCPIWPVITLQPKRQASIIESHHNACWRAYFTPARWKDQVASVVCRHAVMFSRVGQCLEGCWCDTIGARGALLNHSPVCRLVLAESVPVQSKGEFSEDVPILERVYTPIVVPAHLPFRL